MQHRIAAFAFILLSGSALATPIPAPDAFSLWDNAEVLQDQLFCCGAASSSFDGTSLSYSGTFLQPTLRNSGAPPIANSATLAIVVPVDANGISGQGTATWTTDTGVLLLTGIVVDVGWGLTLGSASAGPSFASLQFDIDPTFLAASVQVLGPRVGVQHEMQLDFAPGAFNPWRQAWSCPSSGGGPPTAASPACTPFSDETIFGLPPRAVAAPDVLALLGLGLACLGLARLRR